MKMWSEKVTLEVGGLINSLTNFTGWLWEMFRWIFNFFLSRFLFSTGREIWIKLSLPMKQWSLVPSGTEYWEFHRGWPLECGVALEAQWGGLVGPPVAQRDEHLQQWEAGCWCTTGVLSLHFSKILPEVIDMHIQLGKHWANIPASLKDSLKFQAEEFWNGSSPSPEWLSTYLPTTIQSRWDFPLWRIHLILRLNFHKNLPLSLSFHMLETLSLFPNRWS